MSLIRKVSLAYRMARNEKRAARRQAAMVVQMTRYQEALRLGMIKMPKPARLPMTARMVTPRAELKDRIGEGRLARSGRRFGTDPYELQTYDRKPERNKYAGYFSPGTWHVKQTT